MNNREKIQSDLKDAMRSQNREKVNTLRLITAAIKQVEVDERIEVDEARLLTILTKLVKQRQESIEQFKKAERDDLVAKEQAELEIIQQYLPEPLDENTIKQLIDEAIQNVDAKSMADMGKVMGMLKPKLQGRADMSKISGIIKNKLT